MKTVLAAAALATATLGLAACGDGAEDVEQAVEANPTGLNVANPRLMLSPVAGNPAAIYFDLTNQGDRAVEVQRADVADANRALMHEMTMEGQAMTMAEIGSLTIPPGETVAFAPGGKHVMVFGLSPEVTAGSSTELTLTVSGGDKVSIPVPVQAAGAER